MYYLACYCHGVAELCFSSAEFSKHFCDTSCLNATCRTKKYSCSLNSVHLIGSLQAPEGFEVISEN